jgi:hypothetical protein
LGGTNIRPASDDARTAPPPDVQLLRHLQLLRHRLDNGPEKPQEWTILATMLSNGTATRRVNSNGPAQGIGRTQHAALAHALDEIGRCLEGQVCDGRACLILLWRVRIEHDLKTDESREPGQASLHAD